MRVLLDECVPRPLRREIPEHEVLTVQELGWSGIRNGPLLRLISDTELDVFVTTDQNLEYQQNLGAIGVSVVVLIANRNNLRELRPLVPQLLDALERVGPGEVVHVGG